MTTSSDSSLCNSPASDLPYSGSKARSTSSAPQPEHRLVLQHHQAAMALLHQLASVGAATCGQRQGPSAAVARAQEEVLGELRALRVRPLVDHWLSPGAPSTTSSSTATSRGTAYDACN